MKKHVMKKENKNISQDVKTDLKHDTMEFSAATDGEDKLDIDDPTYTEEDITAEELDTLEEDKPDDLGYALNSVETDRLQDEDNLPEEDWTKDLPDNEEESDK